MSFPPDRSRHFPVIPLLLLIIVARLGTAVYYLSPRFASEPPKITVTPNAEYLSLASPLEIVVTDDGTGLRSMSAVLTVGGVEQTLASEQFREPVREKRITLDLSKLKGLNEGPATLRVNARDASFCNPFQRNEPSAHK